jgi:nitrite reductase/ring-hydroxylating ferredoxin subunit
MKRKTFIQTLLRAMGLTTIGVLSGWFGKLLALHLHPAQIVARVPLIKIKESLFSGEGFFVFKKNQVPQVLSRRCPHLGCTLQEHKATGEIVCPCHGSRFTSEGRYVSGPAKKDMTVLPFSVQKDKIVTIQITQNR